MVQRSAAWYIPYDQTIDKVVSKCFFDLRPQTIRARRFDELTALHTSVSSFVDILFVRLPETAGRTTKRASQHVPQPTVKALECSPTAMPSELCAPRKEYRQQIIQLLQSTRHCLETQTYFSNPWSVGHSLDLTLPSSAQTGTLSANSIHLSFVS